MFRNTFVLYMKRILRRGIYIASGLLMFAGSYDFLLRTAPWAPWVAGIGLLLGYIAAFEPFNGRSNGGRGAKTATVEEVKAVLDRDQLIDLIGIQLGSISSDSKKKWGPNPLPLNYGGERHLFTFGGLGDGKEVQVIVPNLKSLPRSCIVIDPNGQYADQTWKERVALGNRVFILNPYNLSLGRLEDKEKRVTDCARYNPLDCLDPGSVTFVGDAANLAEALIVHQGADGHWSNAARELVAALIMHVCLTRLPEARNLGQVRALLTQPFDPPTVGESLPAVLDTLLEMKNSSFPPLAQKAAHFLEGTGEILSIVSAARMQLAFLDDPAVCDALSASSFHFSDLQRYPTTVYLVLPSGQLDTQSPWLRVLVSSAINELSKIFYADNKQVLIILDEFARLGRLQAVERALALLEKRVQLWPFLHGLPQLQSVYPECWESFVADAGVMQFLTLNDTSTIEYVSHRCGFHLTDRKAAIIPFFEPVISPLFPRTNSFHCGEQMLFLDGLSLVVLCEQVNSFQKIVPYRKLADNLVHFHPVFEEVRASKHNKLTEA